MRTLAFAATFYASVGSCAALIGVGAASAISVGTASAAGLKTFVVVNPPRALPEITVMTMEGNVETLTAGLPAGKPAVVNLWATWCVPCVKELPSLARLQTLLGDKATVSALSVDRGGAYTVGAFLAKTGIAGLNIRLDPRAESLQALQARGMPTTLLLNAAHREVARFEGPAEWDEPDIAAEVKRFLQIP
jgi:thiol-disulfide isomerase/thioredoxin